MKIRLILPIAVACILYFSGNVFAQKQDKKTGGVLQLLKKYDDAWNKKDSKIVSEILAADYIYLTSAGGITSRQRTLDFLISPKYNLIFAERTEINAFRNGNTVVVTSRWKGKGTFDKEEINDDQRCGLVFVKSGKKWRLLSEHCTQIVSK